MIKKMIRYNAFILIGLLALFFFIELDPAIAAFSGFLLSSIFILSSAWVIDQFWEAESKLFIQVFFFSMAIRFLLVLICFGILLGVAKIDEIYFTVSFIISYLYQSVTETIFINQKLRKRSSGK